MTHRTWFSRRLGHTPLRVVASSTGVRVAVRGKHGQISRRSAFVRVAGIKFFATPTRRKRR